MIGWLVSVLGSVLSWLFSPLPLTVLTVTFGCVYYWMTKNYDFWRSRGVRGPTAKFPWGTEFGPPFVSSIVDFEDWLYNKHGGKKFCGYFEMNKPVLYAGDLDLIRLITIKDFEYFADHRPIVLNEDFADMLVVINGPKWKKTRTVMTPTFSGSKMKMMHQHCLDNASNLNTYIKEQAKRTPEFDLKDCFGRFTMDNIASCAFGVNCNSFRDPDTRFAKNAAKLFEVPGAYGSLRLFLVVVLGQWVCKWLPDPSQKCNDFFKNVVISTIGYREKANISHTDFLQLLLESKNKEGERALSTTSIVSQSILFFIAGYETTATLLTFAAYCLATAPGWQREVHREIDDTLEKHGGQLTYEAVSEMTLLDRVISETLRLYPPALNMERQCSKDYTLPGTNVNIPQGTVVQMPILAVHRDPDIYPDPLRFDPDRFLPEQKEQRHPCAYLPFGSGPRNCIAMRFALFEAKVALIAILRENKLEPGPRTPPPPMPLDKRAFLLKPEGGKAYLKVASRAQD